MAKNESYHDFIVPGLDVLIGDPKILKPDKSTKKKAEKLFIPNGYISRISDFYHEQSGRGDACRELLGTLSEILEKIHLSDDDEYTFDNGMKLSFVGSKTNPLSSKDQAIDIAKCIKDKHGCHYSVAIMTGGDQLAALASLNDIDVAHVNPKVYTGRRKIHISPFQSCVWYRNYHIDDTDWKTTFPDEPPLKPNEFVEFIEEDCGQVVNDFQNIGRYDAEEGALVSLRYQHFKDKAYCRIRPQNAGQAMLLEALLAPPEKVPLVVVSGTFGTGKTFLTVCAGYSQVGEGIYDKVFVCPRDGSLGQEIGFVPGDTTEKTRVKAKPIEDNLREVFKLLKVKENEKNTRSVIDKKVENALEQSFEFEPLINMGGRSLSNTFIVFDEFQDMERHQAKALLTRIGNGSKIVVMGDPSQITNPHLNHTSNGLSYSASKLGGKPEAIVVTLNKEDIVRSEAALAIAKYF